MGKQLIKKLLTYKTENTLLRMLLKPVSPVIPRHILNQIPVVGEVRVKLLEGRDLLLDSNENDDVAKNLFWWGLKGFEYETIRLFIHLLRKSKVVFDIGAYNGLYALLAAIIEHKDREVFAFEPVPKTFDCLNRNVQINRCSNLITIRSAVTNYDGEVLLYIPCEMALSASTLKDFRRAKDIIKVPAVTIDSFVARNKISHVDLMKIDTEGTEHKVLEGAKNVIERDGPMIICEVLKGRTEKHLHSILDNTFYKYYWITDRGLIQKEKIEGDKTYEFKNYLFIKETKVETALHGLNVR